MKMCHVFNFGGLLKFTHKLFDAKKPLSSFLTAFCLHIRDINTPKPFSIYQKGNRKQVWNNQPTNTLTYPHEASNIRIHLYCYKAILLPLFCYVAMRMNVALLTRLDRKWSKQRRKRNTKQ